MDNLKIDLPEAVKFIIGRLEEAGFEGFAVGGCVRDSALGKIPADWDITTSARPEKVKELFDKTIDTGIEHGTVTVMIKGQGYEVTTYRIDGEYEDGRHPKQVEFSDSLRLDLERRDFTINAMAYSDKTGLIDYYDGLGDLGRCLIKCVGKPEERFDEDALRMMRAVRFSAQLGFDIDEATYSAVCKLAPNIEKISMERVEVELMKTIMADEPAKAVLYHDSGLFADILPEADRALNKKYREHTVYMLENIRKDKVLRLAALFSMTDYRDAEACLKHLRMDNKTKDRVGGILRYSKQLIEEREPAVREAIFKQGTEQMAYIFDFLEVECKAREAVTGIPISARKRHLALLKNMFDRIIENGDPTSLKDLKVSGNDLMKYGFKGREIGQMLEKLMYAVMDNPKINDKDTLLGMLDILK